MSSPRVVQNTVIICLAGCLFGVTPLAHAQNESESLTRAITLFEEGRYLDAQEVLVAINRDNLTAEEQTVRDDYLNRLQVAITMYEKALRDLEDAETAVAEGDPDAARDLLESVLDNEYAAEPLRRAAESHLRELDQPAAAPPPEQVVQPPPPAEPAPQPVAVPQPRRTNGPTAQAMEQARILTQEADELVRLTRYDEARGLYERALQLVPGYPEAVAGLGRLREHERNIAAPPGDTLIDRIRQENQINWQRTATEYRDLERTIRDHVANNRYEDARQLLVRAGQVVEAGKQFADPIIQYESLKNEQEALAEWVSQSERQYHEEQVARVRREIEEQRRQHLQEVERRRDEQVQALMEQALQHRKDGDLDSAITVLRQVSVIDPKYQPARWMMDDLEDLRQYRRGRDLRDQFYTQQRGALNDVEESKIPWHETLRYPPEWLEIISRPERQGPGTLAPDSRLLGALDKRINVDFANDPFEDVVIRLADAHHLNVIVNWNDLKRAGVDRKVPIELNLPQEITLKKALTEVLDQAGAGSVRLGYSVNEGAIKIATQQTLDRETYTAVYDINDLLMEIPQFDDAPLTDLATASHTVPSSAQVADRPWVYGDDDDDEPEYDPHRSERLLKIIDLIQETVAPDSWIDRGGSVGTIKEINGQLVITQNSAAQQEIGNLLGKLREQRAIQIAVEARFVTVSAHYLEELGIDIDIVLNSGNAGYDYVPTGTGALRDPVLGNALLLPRTFSRLGFTPATPAIGNGLAPTPGFGQLPQPYGQPQFIPQAGAGSGSSGTPVPIINNVLSFTDPSTLGSDVPGSFAGQTIPPAFALFGSFLDNIQVDFLIRATQADSRTTVLTAPRLVLFNGQRSWVAVTIQQNFVSQLNPVVATGAVAQAPQTSTIDSGAVLDVTATVTADRRYVTMTLRPGVTRLLDLQTIPFSGGGAGGGFGGGTALNAFIQLPTLSSQRVQTTVSVPDGGTLLIGGQKLASETEVEAGVPILSKIPILKRAYSSRSMVKDEQTLLILVKPKILIQTEQEELAFPTFGQRG